MSTSLVDIWLTAQTEFNAQAKAYLRQHHDRQQHRRTQKRPRTALAETDANAQPRAPRHKKMRAARAHSPSKDPVPASTAASTRPVAPTSPHRRPQAGTRRSQRRPQATVATRPENVTQPPPQLPPPQARPSEDLDEQLARQLELDADDADVGAPRDRAVLRNYATQLSRAPSSSLSSRMPSWTPSSPSKDSDRTADTRTSRSTTTGRRARSPVKTIFDMSLLDKPCVPMSWSEASKSGVLAIDSDLRRDLNAISQYDRPVVPRTVEAELCALLGDDCYIPAREFGDFAQDAKAANRDFHTIQDIVEQADRCVARRCCEAQWNAEVHSRVLKLALTPFAGRAEYDCITSAAPLEDLVPTVGNTRVQTKYIDYSVQLVPTSPAFQNAIHERLRQQLQDDVGLANNNPPTINQSGYAPIHDRPLAISIETKTPDAGEGGALAQLAVWVSCGHRRVHQLTGTSPETLRLPTMPLLRVVGHTWTLGFAVDLSDKIALVDFPHSIGHTRTVVETYRLLASLRRVVDWADGPYREWFGKVVLGLDGEQ
ncbi:hypothetical protein Micbo1qcDRAFT_216484 [Microdochium bolleyi]|uniref:PD-(D/E)XK nuclease-like domain-containing protein n=1 Tax=Microdochium bolleyi TaxID=196109 RepID=A0A136IRN9_9PEZI|nr:hypothetical protein Micbo1qcDRAFT_216484 [Microdochium bolleyi]